VCVLVLYVLPYVLMQGILSSYLVVSWHGAVLAAVALLASVVLYLWVPKNHLDRYTFGVYLLLLATVAALIINTGGISSPFIALWIAVAVFSGVLGARGYILLTGSVLSYIAISYLQQEPTGNLIVIALAGLLPLIASSIIWHTKSTKEEKHDKAYAELATELSHESSKSEVVLNAINDGVLSLDRQGVIQLINPAAQRMIGWERQDAVGLGYQSVVKLLDGNDRAVTAENDPIQLAITSGKPFDNDTFSIQTAEAGKKVLISLVISPIGTPTTGILVVFRDITQEKAEEREQAEFISTASHEMRTPVASIEGYLGLALNPATAQIDDKAREYITKAQESAKHLGRLFQDLLDVSKAEDGRLSNNPGVVDIVEYIGNVAEGLKPKALEKGLRFLYKPKPDNVEQNERSLTPVLYANVDDDHLREVVANLIENAIKYTPQGDVIVDVDGDETHVRIHVQDSGIGIPNEDIPHLFQKFYRVDNTDTREIGGTGLGLYLCRRLAEVMGGQILVDSEYKKGSTFTLELPRIDHQEALRLLEVASTAREISGAGDRPNLQVQSSLPTNQPSGAIVPQAGPVYSGIPGTPQYTAAPMPPAEQTAQPAQQTADLGPAPTVLEPARQNVPLSSIEQNPNGYTRSASIKVPVRGPDDRN
jgi:PAS domain S-box-containing protein